MCFSAEASFAVGSALIPAGIYCLRAALKKQRYDTLALAAVPLFFGIQQLSEGFVWLALADGSDSADAQAHARLPALGFLFFALSFWPFWFPFFTTLIERRPRRKLVLAIITLFATSWFWILYYPLLVEPDTLLRVETVQHSIHYRYPDLAVYQYVPTLPLRILYLLTLAVPQLISSESWGRLPGLILLISAVVAFLLFEYAFVSVWCFFAAVMAGYCCVVFYRLPGQEQRDAVY